MKVEVSNELRLPEFRILSKSEDDNGTWTYMISPIASPNSCPNCGSEKYVKYGACSRSLQDMPYDDHQILLQIVSSRYRCAECGVVFTQSYSIAEDRAKMTWRLRKWVRERCLSTSFSELAEETGLSKATVGRIAKEYVTEMESTWRYYVPVILGLADVRVGNKKRLVCIDIENNGIAELLEDCTEASLRKYLERAVNDNIEHSFVININEKYRTVIHSIFPYSLIAIDPFFVAGELQAATISDIGNNCDRDLRHALLTREAHLSENQRILLSTEFQRSEKLSALFEFKEQILSIYGMDSPKMAEKSLEEAEAILSPECIHQMAFFKKLLVNKREIIAYIGNRKKLKSSIANGVNLVEMTARKWTGYSFNQLRERLLFGNKRKSATVFIERPAKTKKKQVGFESFMEYVGSYVHRQEDEHLPERQSVYLGNYIDIEEALNALDEIK